jgi:hypothetical protein
MNYAIIENTLVVNTAVADPEYAQSQGWVELTGGAGVGWTYVDGQFIAPVTPPPTPAEIQADNKSQATALLQQTDWTTIPDVADPALSDPYLTNAAEFAAYRSNVRKIAVNPPTTLAVFPPVPEEVWAYTNA